jgi:hypothetical protein
MGLFNSAAKQAAVCSWDLKCKVAAIDTNHCNFLPSEILSGQSGLKAGVLFRKAEDKTASLTVVYSPTPMNQATTAEKIQISPNGEILKFERYIFAGVELPTRADMFEYQFSEYARRKGAISSEALMLKKPVDQVVESHVFKLLSGIIAEGEFSAASFPTRRYRRASFIYDGE